MRNLPIGAMTHPIFQEIFVLLAALIMVASAITAPAQAAETLLSSIKERGVLRAGIRRDIPPHSFIDDKGQWIGFDVDIAQGVAAELGVKLEKVPVDEMTRISYLQNGTIDVAVASLSHTWKRDGAIDFSETYFWSKQTFLVDAAKVKSYAELVGKPVGMSRGSHAIGNWRDWLAKHGHPWSPEVIVEFGNKQAAVEAVRQGAIVGYAEDYEVLASFAQKNPGLDILAADYIGMKQNGIGIRENDSKLRDAINSALQGLQKTGAYDAIYDRWFGTNSSMPIPREVQIEVWPNG
jgi:polar amino acid transport system substrate-binding protein